jgi:hypothetical protein
LFRRSLNIPKFAPNIALSQIVAALGLIRPSIIPFHYGVVSRSNCVPSIFSTGPAYNVFFITVEGNFGDLLRFNGPEILRDKLRVPSIACGVYEILY